MAKITKADVEHVAKLSRLEINEEEKDKFTEQFSSVLEYFEKLDQADANDAEAISQINDMKNIATEDEVRGMVDREEMLANAPEKEDGFIKVKAVFESGE